MSTTGHSTIEHGGEPQVVDTLALLQEEIARLESELRLRDELAAAEPAPATPDRAGDDGRDRRIGELTAELAERERTIEVLWEQVAILEEAEVASRAEWEQLHRWVEALEGRIEGGAGPVEAGAELEAARRECEALRGQLDQERHSWAVQRRSLEEEIHGLRARLEEAAQQRSPDEARAALERENRRLRQECHRLAAAEAIAASAEDFRVQLNHSREELDEAQRQLMVLRGQMESRSLEHQAELANARAQALREHAANADGLSLNEKMRALRDHLSELHDREEEERRQRRLSTRIARLWTRTAP